MFYTIQLSKWRKLDPSIKIIDITVKNSQHFLKPSWGLVMDSKSGKIKPEEYTVKYFALLKQRYDLNPEQFLSFIKEGKENDLALSCFCSGDKFCHRFLAIEFLEKIAKENNLEFIYKEELFKNK